MQTINKGGVIAHSKGKGVRRCVAVDQHERLVRTDPAYRWRRREIEREVQDWARRYGRGGLRSGLIRIPVVVHVVYRTDAENISDAQIQSQIDVLNRDFRRLNTDADQTPAAFAGVAADPRLEFALAVRDPSCAPTSGITRTHTTVSGWVFPSDAMKSAASGGADPWDTSKYLNIWVVNYLDGTLGYGTFPGMPANIQGVVCHYTAFGATGNVAAPYHLGRTATHEIGHYLNLNHIWGDDGGSCLGSDNVDDTPNQARQHFGMPTFPSISCSNGPNGDMFMNYMDYTDDAGMNMFTAGQVVRMDATLHTQRTGLLASDALVLPSDGATPDLWMKDVSDDLGDEPDPSAQAMWLSDDIWVRKTNDGLANQDHQSAEYRPAGAAPNFVYVRVRNRGCSGAAGGTLKLYWAKASPSLAWPAPWDGSITAPVLMGGAIGAQLVSVPGGGDEIVSFPWMPPNPADYASFGAEQGHFCLLARLETSAEAPYGMSVPEGGDLIANVRENNNIVWKNISVLDEVPGAGRVSGVIIGGYSDEAQHAKLVFTSSKSARPSIFEAGEVIIEATPSLMECCVELGEEEHGIRRIDGTRFEVLRSGATLGVFKLERGAVHGLSVRVVQHQKRRLGARVLTLDLVQAVRGRVVGGQRFVLKTDADPRGVTLEKGATTFDGVGWVPREGGGCGCGG